MSNVTLSIRAHFDGKVIVPDEPVNLPVNAALEVDVRPRGALITADEATVASRLVALRNFVARGVHGALIPDQRLRREHLYDDNGDERPRGHEHPGAPERR